ncbi:MAG: hypothetical protein Q7U71_04305 [bacterium]|nr:hypothetical protein [bacterium]
MKKAIIASIVIMVTFIPVILCYGQITIRTPETLQQKYESLYLSQTVRMHHTLWSGEKILSNEKEYPLGYMSKLIYWNLRGDSHKVVYSEYKKYVNNNRKKNIFLTISYAFSGAGIGTLSRPHIKNSDLNISIAFFVSSFISALAGQVCYSNALDDMDKTIWLYNREIMGLKNTLPDTTY